MKRVHTSCTHHHEAAANLDSGEWDDYVRVRLNRWGLFAATLNEYREYDWCEPDDEVVPDYIRAALIEAADQQQAACIQRLEESR